MKWPRLFSGELPSALQFGAIVALWAVWLAAVGWVWFWARKHAHIGRDFASPSLVYSTVLLGMPLVLSVVGVLFLVRLGLAAPATVCQRVFYWGVAGLTTVAVIVFVFGWFSELPFIQPVIE